MTNIIDLSEQRKQRNEDYEFAENLANQYAKYLALTTNGEFVDSKRSAAILNKMIEILIEDYQIQLHETN
jgi:hypothetical protein